MKTAKRTLTERPQAVERHAARGGQLCQVAAADAGVSGGPAGLHAGWEVLTGLGGSLVCGWRFGLHWSGSGFDPQHSQVTALPDHAPNTLSRFNAAGG